jgi:hypothetical protein
MPNYNAHYAFEVLDAEDKPKDERWGFGIMPINTDVDVTSDEHLFDIAAEIGRACGYNAVQVLNIVPRETDIDVPETIPGDVVVD